MRISIPQSAAAIKRRLMLEQAGHSSLIRRFLRRLERLRVVDTLKGMAYVIPANAEVLICRFRDVGSGSVPWRRHRLRDALRFDDCESHMPGVCFNFAVERAEEVWLLRAPADCVRVEP